jgi:hypothetical protein
MGVARSTAEGLYSGRHAWPNQYQVIFAGTLAVLISILCLQSARWWSPCRLPLLGTLSPPGSLVCSDTLALLGSLSSIDTLRLLGSLEGYDTLRLLGSLSNIDTLSLPGSLRCDGTLSRPGSLRVTARFRLTSPFHDAGTLDRGRFSVINRRATFPQVLFINTARYLPSGPF